MAGRRVNPCPDQSTLAVQFNSQPTELFPSFQQVIVHLVDNVLLVVVTQVEIRVSMLLLRCNAIHSGQSKSKGLLQLLIKGNGLLVPAHP